ncbi:MAG: homoserine O-succinyltransferase [Spirochaetales bacterium]|nr:homoserine O-succinyltransferase [Spirochaetales bacterium]
MIVIPEEYHIKKDLEKAQVLCISQQQAMREDLRALRIGILNIMPQAEAYEFSLLQPLGCSVMQIEPVWVRLRSHVYSSTNQKHLENIYVYFEDAIAKQRLDALLLTGAPVEEIPFEEVAYWDELTRIFRYARRNIASTFGICWGGLALAKFLGINKTVFPKKIFGVYETQNLVPNHRITGNMDDVFFCPQSRHSGIPDDVLEKERDKGTVNLLAYAGKEVGYTIFESTDNRFLMHLGHPEYEPQRLIDEYERDSKKGRTDVEPPVNFDIAKPLNRWRAHRTELFSQWIRFVKETTMY